MIEELSRDKNNNILTTNWAQTVPVLCLKKKQIPNIEIIASISPSRCESLLNQPNKKEIDLENPLDRNKIYNRK